MVGGSHLFHAASLWALKIASRVVDMVFYSSVPENNEIVEKCKEEFRDGIIVPRNDLDRYIKEADCVLIGPGMLRQEFSKTVDQYIGTSVNQYNGNTENTGNTDLPIYRSTDLPKTLSEINSLQDEGQQTYELTKYILSNYKDKRFVLDAGAPKNCVASGLKV